jgi:hypothetical protein
VVVPCLACHHAGSKPTGRFSERTLFAEHVGDLVRISRGVPAIQPELDGEEAGRLRDIWQARAEE